MSEREPSVTERFRKDLRLTCARASILDMSAPTGGKDRHWNADEFFAVGGRFFIVEFKSRKGSLRTEDRKASACTLCAGLESDIAARMMHDMAHFAAWGEKEREGHLLCNVGVYRSLVCNNKVLPSCFEMKNVHDDDQAFESAVGFVSRAIGQEIGLEAEDFGNYLRWLLKNSGGACEDSAQKLGLFGFSYNNEVEEMIFNKFDDFEVWAKKASIVANAKPLSTQFPKMKRK